MAIITISGQYGSRGSEIAKETAKLLDFSLVDRDILATAAQRTGIGIDRRDQKDMKIDTVKDRLSVILETFLSRSGAAYLGDPYLSGEPLISRTYAQQSDEPQNEEQRLDDNKFLELTKSIIEELASQPNLVIVGRGSSYILKEHPRVLHVLITSPEENRILWAMQNDDLSEEQAIKAVRDREKFRAAFIKKFFGAEALDPSWFDLVLQTHRLSNIQYAAVISEAAKGLDARVVGGALNLIFIV